MKRVLNFLVSLLFLIAALYFLNWNSLTVAFQKANPYVVSLAVLISLANYFILAVRWYKIVNVFVFLPPLEHMRLYLYCTFMNTFTPANLGGDAYRLFSLRSQGTGVVPVIIALAQERIVGLLSHLLGYLLCLSGLWFTESTLIFQSKRIFLFAGGIILIATVGIILFPLIIGRAVSWNTVRSRLWLYKTMKDIYRGTKFHSLANFTVVMFLSFSALLLWILTIYMIALNLQIKVSLWAIGVVIILVEFIRVVPITLQGMGVREATFAYFLSLFGESPEAGFALGTLSYLTLSLSLLASGIMGWCLMRFRFN